MIRNYFLVAFRNLTRNKFFSAINIFGLAVSMSICMGIIMLVADQMNYDRYNTNRDRIYRINTKIVDNNGVERNGPDNATSQMTLRQELLENYTGVEKVVRIKRGFGNNWLEVENQNVNIPVKGFFADAEVFELFQLEFEYGDPETALTQPYTVVLTRKAADKLFKEENPVGLSFKVGDIGTYTVTGVLKETQNKSHLVFEALASMETVNSLHAQHKDQGMDDWLDFWNGWTYILIDKSKTIDNIIPHLDKIYKQRIVSITKPDVLKARYAPQSLMAITPGPLINNPIGPSLPWVFVYFLGGLALVILLTSCFNFTNLSIARSLKRAKEIGVRKVTGAARWQIFTQFLSESVLISFCALTLAFGFLILVKPLILQLTFARLFMWDLEANSMVFAVFAVFALVVGVFAGFFPAVILSAFDPVKVLKSVGNLKLFSKMGLRKVLLVSQFTISLVFILTVIVMYNQLSLFLNKDYGFTMENNIMVRLNETSGKNLKTELLKYSNVKSVTLASHVPASGTTYGENFKKDLSEKEWTSINFFNVDEDYLKNMEVDLAAGKFYDASAGDANKNFIVINERALKTFNYSTVSDALGQEIIFQPDSSRKVIIGVVRDYNHGALISEIAPMALMYNPNDAGIVQIRYTGDYTSAVSNIEKAWVVTNPGLKIDLKTVEAEIKYFYNTIFGDIVNIVGVIAGLAIMISCLGLLGMATYTIETRMKEVSIRKVLGSSDQALVLLLSKGFFKLLMISVVIGVPLAYLLNNLWLQFMAYRTELSVGVISLGVGVLILFGAITVGSQTIRAAFANPTDNLKNE